MGFIYAKEMCRKPISQHPGLGTGLQLALPTHKRSLSLVLYSCTSYCRWKVTGGWSVPRTMTRVDMDTYSMPLLAYPRGFSTCIESSHVTCSQRLRILIGIICLYGFVLILYRFISIYMALIFLNMRKKHSWFLSTCIWSFWSYLVNIWSDCEWIGPRMDRSR